MPSLMTRGKILTLACGAVFASACTTSPTGTTKDIFDFISSTTPGAWSTKDGLLRAEFRPIAFTTFNYDTVKGDIARGHGEHLTSLATLLGVSRERCKEFGLLAQARYAGLESPRTTPEEILVSMKSILNAHPDLVSGRNVN
ncbi:MAG: DUF3015 domain-containing protein [Nitrospira sp. CR1.3]|nr:DUF3015 domain-containing protein [Nitrospira sp. CR1.3]